MCCNKETQSSANFLPFNCTGQVSSGAGWKRSGVKVEFSNLAFHFSALTGLTDTQLDGVLEELYTRVETRERAELWGLARLGRAFSAVCYPRQGQGSQQEDAERSDKLKSFVRDYFQEAERLVPDTAPECEPCQVRGLGPLVGCYLTCVAGRVQYPGRHQVLRLPALGSQLDRAGGGAGFARDPEPQLPRQAVGQGLQVQQSGWGVA